MRGAAGGRQPTAVKPALVCTNCVCVVPTILVRKATQQTLPSTRTACCASTLRTDRFGRSSALLRSSLVGEHRTRTTQQVNK